MDIIFAPHNFDLTPEIADYVKEKINKHAELLKDSSKVSVLIKQNMSNHNSVRGYRFEVSAVMPSAYIRVERKGTDVKALIDEIEVILKRQLSRYHQQHSRWHNKSPWKAESITPDDISLMQTEPDDYTNYEPKIKRKTYTNDTPIHPAQAIEQMELIGHSCFLFKNIETSKYAMIYKRGSGGYGMIEPE